MNRNSNIISDNNLCINIGIKRECMNCSGYNPNCSYYESYTTRIKDINSANSSTLNSKNQ